MNKVQYAILKIVNANDGRFSWYQIDRALSEFTAEHAGRLMQLLRDLIVDGLIEVATGANPAQPVYFITEKGITAIQNAEEDNQ